MQIHGCYFLVLLPTCFLLLETCCATLKFVATICITCPKNIKEKIIWYLFDTRKVEDENHFMTKWLSYSHINDQFYNSCINNYIQLVNSYKKKVEL